MEEFLMRSGARRNDQVRNAKITRNYIKHAEGSVLIEVGDTKVICTASIEEKVPPFLKGSGEGWITAEYNMLPRSTARKKSVNIPPSRFSPLKRRMARVTPSLRRRLSMTARSIRMKTATCPSKTA